MRKEFRDVGYLGAVHGVLRGGAPWPNGPLPPGSPAFIYIYTMWPRKNATTLIVNFKDIINKMESIFLFYYYVKFIFQQNDNMIINFG